MPRVEYSPHKRTRVKMLHEMGFTRAQIAAQEGVNRHSVKGIVTRYRHQTSARTTPRSGRPKIISDRDKRHIFRIIKSNPFIKNRDILREANLRCSERTLERALKAEGIQHTLALRRPKLTPEIAEKRLQFAQRYQNQDINWWRHWVFSDEVSIARGDGERHAWVFCRRVSRYNTIRSYDTNCLIGRKAS